MENLSVISVSEIVDWNVAKKCVRAGVRPCRKDTDNVVMEWRDLEIFFYIPIKDGIAYVSKELAFDKWCVSYDDLYDTAVGNTAVASGIMSMANMLGMENMDDYIYVITNHEGFYGAGAILCNDVLDNACRILHTTHLCVIPSSIHELIVLDGAKLDMDEVAAMIQEINQAEVIERDRLGNHPYKYEKGKGFQEV